MAFCYLIAGKHCNLYNLTATASVNIELNYDVISLFHFNFAITINITIKNRHKLCKSAYSLYKESLSLLPLATSSFVDPYELFL